jgi:transcriptional regulator of arginine metabolism
MLKAQRQSAILEIIRDKNVETQEQLLAELQQRGYASTQATISRDIKELRIVKELTHNGVYRYTAPSKDSGSAFSAKLNTIFRECVTTYDAAQNLVVIKTLPGLASAACSTVDSMQMPQVVGTLAGDDTAVLIMRDNTAAAEFCAQIKRLFRE